MVRLIIGGTRRERGEGARVMFGPKPRGGILLAVCRSGHYHANGNLLSLPRKSDMSYLIATAGLALAWLVQLYIVFPIEEVLRGDGSAIGAFSYLFLPHGAKVLVAVLLMQASIPVILIISFGFGLFFGFAPDYALYGAVLASATAILPLWVVNLTLKRPLNFRVWSVTRDHFSLFRFVFAISIAVALLNSMFQAALATVMLDVNPDIMLTIGFLVGDFIGGIVCIIAAVFGARFALRRFGYAV